MVKKVVRIQHNSNGKEYGIFHAHDNNMIPLIEKHSNCEEIYKRHGVFGNFPGYNNDEKLKKQISLKDLEKYRFAFNNIENLNKAFTKEEINEFIKLGFQIFLIETEDYFESDYQTIYNPLNILSILNITKDF